MYQPVHHREEKPEILHALIRAHPLGLLVSNGPDGPLANPLPFLLDADVGAKGRLRAHLARANPHWREIAARTGESVVVVFQGEESYITPSWYATKRETGKVVPTWNYVMVQVRGRARVVEDGGWLAAQIAALTDMQEGNRAEPWAVGDAPESFIEMQMRAIVGIEITIDDIAGKWKVSQNRPQADRLGVAEGLAGTGKAGDHRMAEIVREFGGLDRTK